jgi:hypothetical protein
MKLFLHTFTRIRVINGDLEWSGTPNEFWALEPDYPGLPILTNAQAVCRYQSPELKYIEDANGNRHPDIMCDALPYCDKINTYVPGQSIYVHVQMSATQLNADDAAAHIDFTAQFRATEDPNGAILPISAGWLIKLRHESGQVDLFPINFINGECAYIYQHTAGLPLGDWYLSESDFGLVTVGEQTYKVKLANPVRFAVYRLLA